MTQPIDRLRQIMAQLRDKDTGCAWDIEQTFATIAPYTIEEAYEVADAIERGNYEDVCEELGDVLLQVVFQAQIAAEEGRFDFDDVATVICEKLVRRHPHVFSDGPARTPEEIEKVWDEIKAEEKAGKPQGLVDQVPANFPALVRAQKMQKKVAKAGLDWPDIGGVADKVAEEVAEFQAATASGDPAAMTDEFGDLLFSLVNLARHTGIDADEALRGANAKFAARVRAIEAAAKADGVAVDTFDAAEWDKRWNAAKAATRPK
ncbi:nucleoside triphosphate pyrophosphohydrolase [Acuticoccus sp. MNP-M23]|uniref:nucleoside triphosphate pyrophosphohydrolase n=1 Tax=Acuticoccus sp. MNP-M23 TaxID=3072793 RepID=UPI0028152C56|nr:nucleoside triphosphate pyrophosphohydrolase [Acuticoccus sp. MNP-M23]WMS42187.1 nucleoside triphosphate pyrophosphohydrolase [Acuticoccus sp. MNP-M23]